MKYFLSPCQTKIKEGKKSITRQSSFAFTSSCAREKKSS